MTVLLHSNQRRVYSTFSVAFSSPISRCLVTSGFVLTNFFAECLRSNCNEEGTVYMFIVCMCYPNSATDRQALYCSVFVCSLKLENSDQVLLIFYLKSNDNSTTSYYFFSLSYVL